MIQHFVALGMTTIGDVARTPLAVLKSKFRARFGKQLDIQAEVMWRTANGLDDSPVTPIRSEVLEFMEFKAFRATRD